MNLKNIVYVLAVVATGLGVLVALLLMQLAKARWELAKARRQVASVRDSARQLGEGCYPGRDTHPRGEWGVSEVGREGWDVFVRCARCGVRGVGKVWKVADLLAILGVRGGFAKYPLVKQGENMI